MTEISHLTCTKQKAVIDFIFRPNCPYIDEAKKLIEKLKKEPSVSMDVREWNTSSDETPSEFRHYESPSYLINGKRLNPSSEKACRCIRPHKKLPSYNALKKAVIQAMHGKSSLVLALTSIPTALLSLLPFANCPCSFVATVALLSSVGLSWINSYIIPLFIFFLSTSLICLYTMAKKSKRFIFFAFAVASSALLILGKWLDVTCLAHIGAFGLIAASLCCVAYKKFRNGEN